MNTYSGGADSPAGPGPEIRGCDGLHPTHLPGGGPARLLQGPGAQPAACRPRHHDHLPRLRECVALHAEASAVG